MAETKMAIIESQESLYKKAMAKIDAEEAIVSYKFKIDNYQQAADMFETVGDYLDAPAMAESCRKKIEQAVQEDLEERYTKAIGRLKDAKEDSQLQKLEVIFKELGEYKDSAKQLSEVLSRRAAIKRKHSVKRGIVLTILALLVAGGVAGFFTGFFRYALGIGFMKGGMYSQALYEFNKVPDFEGSQEQILKVHELSLRDAEVGKVVLYGNYEWKALAVEEDSVLLIASNVGEKSTFYHRRFHNELKDVTWQDSYLRRWLNEDVYQDGFSDSEREHLLVQDLEPTENAEYSTGYTEAVQDYLTILSVDEAEEYKEVLDTLGGKFWLRNPGNDMTTAVYRSSDTDIMSYGYPVTEEMIVRPVIRVDTSWLKEVNE